MYGKICNTPLAATPVQLIVPFSALCFPFKFCRNQKTVQISQFYVLNTVIEVPICCFLFLYAATHNLTLFSLHLCCTFCFKIM